MVFLRGALKAAAATSHILCSYQCIPPGVCDAGGTSTAPLVGAPSIQDGLPEVSVRPAVRTRARFSFSATVLRRTVSPMASARGEMGSGGVTVGKVMG